MDKYFSKQLINQTYKMIYATGSTCGFYLMHLSLAMREMSIHETYAPITSIARHTTPWLTPSNTHCMNRDGRNTLPVHVVLWYCSSMTNLTSSYVWWKERFWRGSHHFTYDSVTEKILVAHFLLLYFLGLRVHIKLSNTSISHRGWGFTTPSSMFVIQHFIQRMGVYNP